MAENPYINKVEIADGEVLMDLTHDTITAEHMLDGAVAHASSGAQINGTILTYDGQYTVSSNT